MEAELKRAQGIRMQIEDGYFLVKFHISSNSIPPHPEHYNKQPGRVQLQNEVGHTATAEDLFRRRYTT